MPAFRYRRSSQRDAARFLTVLAAHQAGCVPEVSARLLGGPIGGPDIRIELVVNGVTTPLQRALPA